MRTFIRKYKHSVEKNDFGVRRPVRPIHYRKSARLGHSKDQLNPLKGCILNYSCSVVGRTRFYTTQMVSGNTS